ncbi:MAG: SBBP repeat-containing protein [Deltaproteobacteria bacterium]|nr:SBBP repeat-containing protein [Deltaproteobacteria bacterium]
MDARVRQLYGQLPLSFELNQGQSDPRVKFLSRGQGYTLFLTATEAVLSLRAPNNLPEHCRSTRRTSFALPLPKRPTASRDCSVLGIKLERANRNPQISGVDQLAGRSNYFIGDNPKNWHTAIPTFGRVRYSGIYPGVDLLYRGSQRQLEYDFVLAPQSDPDGIELRFAGAKRLRVDQEGNLVVQMAGRQVIEHAPVIYQEIGGRRRPVAGGYVLKSRDKVGFKLASYDHHNPVTIDPSLAYSIYLGGSSVDGGLGVAVDSSGDAYVTGFTDSSDFPTRARSLQTTFGGVRDAFVTKLNSTGSALVYSTYLGGSGYDAGLGVAVDSSGNAYVTGQTNSTDFPTTAGALQASFGGGFFDAFVSKLNNTGSALVYSTYLGGSNSDVGVGITVDRSSNAYITGETISTDFPTTPGALQALLGGGFFDAFVTKLNRTGSSLVYSTYLGGSGLDEGRSVAVSSSGNVYVTGITESKDFPTSLGALQTALGGIEDAFVSKLNSTGSVLVYSTYLGDSSFDEGLGIAVDRSGNTYVTGPTSSSDFPTTLGALQATLGGLGDAFVSKLNSTGSALVYSTYLGGSSADSGFGIAVDPSGNAYVTGSTNSSDFPTTAGALQTTFGGSADAFVSKFLFGRPSSATAQASAN